MADNFSTVTVDPWKKGKNDTVEGMRRNRSLAAEQAVPSPRNFVPSGFGDIAHGAGRFTGVVTDRVDSPTAKEKAFDPSERSEAFFFAEVCYSS